MTLNIKAATAICNNFSSLVSTESPALSLEFILHHTGKAPSALEHKRIKIITHPAGATCWQQLESYAKSPKDTPSFTGLSIAAERSIKSFFLPQYKALGVFFLNLDKFKNEDVFKNELLNYIWHAIHLFNESDSAQEKTITYLQKPFITTSKDPFERAKNNLLADSFAAFTLELTGERKALEKLARRRCNQTISPIKNFNAEFYPFPMALDAVTIINNELGTAEAKQRPISNAYKMASEVMHTIDNQALRQWITFTLSAQEMAWMGASHQNILGAAVYHGDDIYIRSTGYIIAETLGIEPALPINYTGYDSFIDIETNKQRHEKAQQKTLSTLLNLAEEHAENLQEIDIALTEHAIKQNDMLLSGNPVGWSSYPIICIIEDLEQRQNISKEQLEELIVEVFEENASKIPWKSILALNKLIMSERRTDKKFTGNDLITRILQTQIPHTEELAYAFNLQKDQVITSLEPIFTQESNAPDKSNPHIAESAKTAPPIAAPLKRELNLITNEEREALKPEEKKSILESLETSFTLDEEN